MVSRKLKTVELKKELKNLMIVPILDRGFFKSALGVNVRPKLSQKMLIRFSVGN